MKIELKTKFENIVFNLDKSYTVSFKSNSIDKGTVENLFNELNKMSNNGNNDLKLIVDKYEKKHRSLNANNYSWKLQDEIAKKLNTSIDEIHDKMVLEYGVLETLSVIKEALESLTRAFDYYKILGESELNGKKFVHLRVGIGTHNYNTEEMARFIDGVVSEAKELGIQTETPEQIAEMKSLWRNYETKNK